MMQRPPPLLGTLGAPRLQLTPHRQTTTKVFHKTEFGGKASICIIYIGVIAKRKRMIEVQLMILTSPPSLSLRLEDFPT